MIKWASYPRNKWDCNITAIVIWKLFESPFIIAKIIMIRGILVEIACWSFISYMQRLSVLVSKGKNSAPSKSGQSQSEIEPSISMNKRKSEFFLYKDRGIIFITYSLRLDTNFSNTFDLWWGHKNEGGYGQHWVCQIWFHVLNVRILVRYKQIVNLKIKIQQGIQ